MKHLLLKAKRSIIPSDFTFLAKAPLLPKQYIWKSGKGKLALLSENDSNNLLLLTNQEDFLKAYREYYERYFTVEELEHCPPLGRYQLIYGEHSISQVANDSEEDEDLENSDDIDQLEKEA